MEKAAAFSRGRLFLPRAVVCIDRCEASRCPSGDRGANAADTAGSIALGSPCGHRARLSAAVLRYGEPERGAPLFAGRSIKAARGAPRSGLSITCSSTPAPNRTRKRSKRSNEKRASRPCRKSRNARALNAEECRQVVDVSIRKPPCEQLRRGGLQLRNRVCAGGVNSQPRRLLIEVGHLASLRQPAPRASSGLCDPCHFCCLAASRPRLAESSERSRAARSASRVQCCRLYRQHSPPGRAERQLGPRASAQGAQRTTGVSASTELSEVQPPPTPPPRTPSGDGPYRDTRRRRASTRHASRAR